MCQDPRRLLTPAADTNKHEQQRSAPDLCGRSTEAQGPLVNVDRPRDRPDKDEARGPSPLAGQGNQLDESGLWPGSAVEAQPTYACVQPRVRLPFVTHNRKGHAA